MRDSQTAWKLKLVGYIPLTLKKIKGGMSSKKQMQFLCQAGSAHAVSKEKF